MNKETIGTVTGENQSFEFIDILIEPSRRKNKIIPDCSDVWDHNGEAIVTASRQPFLDSARKLLQSGTSPNVILRMFRLRDCYPSLTAPITVAAGLTVKFSQHAGEYFSNWEGVSCYRVKSRKRLNEKGATLIAKRENKSVPELMS